MAEEFLSNSDWLRDDGGDRGSIPPGDVFFMPVGGSGHAQRLRVILMGPIESVRGMIHRFHTEGIAEVGDWSRILPVPNSDEFMSILIVRRSQG